MRDDQLAQTRGGHEVIARSEEAEQATQRVQRKDLPAPHRAPDARELARRLHCLRMGADKFANVLVNWERYLAPWVAHLSPLSALHTMHIVGVIEIVAGIAVAIKPRYGAYLVAAWLAGIIVNLLSYSGYYDIALRDFGLMLAALTLARLASKFDPPGLSFLHRD